jgi:CDP-glycerol glycerophosphotransferase (TagB/SpsB family)
MKWVKVRDGVHKLVEDSDERPAVKLPNKKIGIPFIPYSPSWRKYEEGMHSDNAKTSIESSEKFEKERDHTIKTDPQAARWEKSRKERWQKDKTYYVKKVEEAGI